MLLCCANRRKLLRNFRLRAATRRCPHVIHRGCGTSVEPVIAGKLTYFLGRSFKRKTNFSPDHTSSMAQTFTSTIPFARPISRTIFSLRSLGTPEVFFGHDTQSIPAGVSFAA